MLGKPDSSVRLSSCPLQLCLCCLPFLPAAAVSVLPVLLPVDIHNGSGHMPWSADLQAVFRKDVR
jgi:hypothetical protein